MRGFIVGFLLASVLLGGAWILTRHELNRAASEKTHAAKYHCPMHPTYVSDRPGNCPICGMKLVLTGSESAPQPDHLSHATETSEAAPEGYAAVNVEPDKLQLLGVSTTEVKEMAMDQSIRTTARIVPDETRVHHVHSKFDGYIEEVYADYTGQFVKAGEPLFSIYSPELLATQREYLLALKAIELQGDAGIGTELLEAARQRLALWDVGPKEIDKIRETGQPIKAIIVRSPVSGYITAKTAIHGTRVTPSDSLYDIVDLSRVWVVADVYEINVPFVKPGMPATVELPYESNQKFQGKVAYVDPVLDPVSRTVKARIEIPNSGTTLKPEMFATVNFGGASAKTLVVPDSAVLSTGERMIVFVDQGNGRFQPREITTGARVRGFYEVKSGLTAGERVVTSGNFLLDSESRLRAASSDAQHQH